MATNFPGSLDNFTNPVAGDSQNSPSHSLQHADINDAVEALETKLGIGNSPAGSATAGHVLVASTGGTSTWTTVGASAISITGATNGYVLTAGTASTSWQPSAILVPIVAAKTGAYTLADGDQGKLIELNGTFTVTVPLDSTFNFAIGTQINILNIGTGVITTAGAGGVTLNGNPGLKLSGQWSGATFVKRAANTWVIIGDLIA